MAALLGPGEGVGPRFRVVDASSVPIHVVWKVVVRGDREEGGVVVGV